MKKEILRINNLNVEYSTTEKLVNISMFLLEGECVGLLGLVNSGQYLLVDLLCGNQEIDMSSFYITGRKCSSVQDMKKDVYKITVVNYVIDDWSVAEYICLVDDKAFLGILNRRKLESKADELMKIFGLNIDVRKKLKKLTGLEKRLIDLVKAYYKQVKIIVIEDEFEGCSTQDIKHFKEILGKVVKKDVAAVIISHSGNVSHILSDKYIFFKKGHIVKKCSKDFIQDNCHLENYLLTTSTISKKKDLDNYKNEISSSKEVVYSVYNMNLKNRNKINFNFFKSEVVTILALDMKEKKQIFELLSGRTINKNMDIILEGKSCNFNDIIDFVEEKIASIGDMGGESELLLSMSAGSNLLMPSMEKISAIQHVFTEHRVVKMLEKEVKENIPEKQENIMNMSVNDYILLLLERWHIYKPKVLILFEPFVHCDMYGVSLVKSYIKKFTEIGSTVIIVKSREEYVEDISDRIIRI